MFYCCAVVMALFCVFGPTGITQSCKTRFGHIRKVERQLESVHYCNYSEGITSRVKRK